MPTSVDAPRKKTPAVWMSPNSESKPITDGVMMRLVVTVWKSTVETATATPTTTMPASRRLRAWRAYSHDPVTPTVRKAAAATTAMTASSAITRRRRRRTAASPRASLDTVAVTAVGSPPATAARGGTAVSPWACGTVISVPLAEPASAVRSYPDADMERAAATGRARAAGLPRPRPVTGSERTRRTGTITCVRSAGPYPPRR